MLIDKLRYYRLICFLNCFLSFVTVTFIIFLQLQITDTGILFSVTCPLVEDLGNVWETCLHLLRYFLSEKKKFLSVLSIKTWELSFLYWGIILSWNMTNSGHWWLVLYNLRKSYSDVQTVVAVAMLVRRFNFQMALGAPPVSKLPCTFCSCLQLLLGNDIKRSWLSNL